MNLSFVEMRDTHLLKLKILIHILDIYSVYYNGILGSQILETKAGRVLRRRDMDKSPFTT